MADTGQEKIGYTLMFLASFLAMFTAVVIFMPPELLSSGNPSASYLGDYPDTFDPSDVLSYSFYYPVNGAYLYGNASGDVYYDSLLGGWHVSDSVPMYFAKDEGDLDNPDDRITVFWLDDEFEAPNMQGDLVNINGGFFVREKRGAWYGSNHQAVSFDEVITMYDSSRGFSAITLEAVRNHPDFILFVLPEEGYSIEDVREGHAYIYVGESAELSSVSATDAWSLIARFFTFSMPYTGESDVDTILNIAITGPIIVLIVYIAVRLIALFIPFT